MARHFNGTTDFLNMGTGVRGADLFGILAMCWINLDDTATEHTPLSRWDNTANEQWILTVNAGGKVTFAYLDSSNTGHAATGATSLSAGTWYHVAGMFDGSNVYVFVNGVQDGILASSATMKLTVADPVNVGRQANGTAWFKGSIAEAQLVLVNQSVTPSAQMRRLVAANASGASPSDAEGMFDTDHIGYWPLLGDSPEPNYTGNTTTTGAVTGTTVVNHPPVRTLTSFGTV